MVGDQRFWLVLLSHFVALAARSRNMSAGQFKLGLLVLCQREGRWPVSFEVVALVAAVFVRLPRELFVVFIFVTVGAALEIHDLKDRGLALGRVATAAVHLRVPVNQGIVGFRVGLHVEQRRLPALHVVTRRALDSLRPLGELSVVVVLVTVDALRERQLFLEVALYMACLALNGRVFSKQGILRLRVVEVIAQSGI